MVKHTEAKRGFALLPRHWVVKRDFVWAVRFRRLARDYERLAATLAGLPYPVFAIPMLANLVRISAERYSVFDSAVYRMQDAKWLLP